MDLYVVVNIGLIVGVLAALGIVTWEVRRWRRRQIVGLVARSVELVGVDEEGDLTLTSESRAWLAIKEFQGLMRFVRFLNIATTVLALIPTVFALFNLVTNHQRQALIFNLLSLALVFVAKGVLFVLTVFITGAVTGAGTVVGTRAVKKAWDRWDAQKEQPPTR